MNTDTHNWPTGGECGVTVECSVVNGTHVYVFTCKWEHEETVECSFVNGTHISNLPPTSLRDHHGRWGWKKT